MTAVAFVRQRSLFPGDGDCLRAAVASLAGVDYDRVPDFGRYLRWWDAMRAWARGSGRGDFACFPTDGGVRQWFANPDDPEWSGLLIGSGPSPRGAQHAVLVTVDLGLVWDPHPSDAGVTRVDEVFALVADPYWPPPVQLALPAGPTPTGASS